MRSTIAVSGALVALLVACAPAGAAEVSRPEYREAVEPICRTSAKANERVLRNVKAQVRKGKLKPAARRFAKASRALARTHRQLLVVPQPMADESRLARWLAHVKIEANLFKAVSVKLRKGQKGAAQAKVNKLTSNANRANALVLAFDFRYCRFEPSKFL